MNPRTYRISCLAAFFLLITTVLAGCSSGATTVYIPYTPQSDQSTTTTIYPTTTAYTPPPTTVYVPPTTTKAYTPPPTTTQQIIWSATPNQIIGYGNWAAPATGVYISSGKTLSLTWSADGNMDCFIFTETQYLNFKPLGVLSGYVAHNSGSQGTVTAYVQNGDTYYIVVRNQSSLGSIKLYQATLTAS